MFRKLEEIKKDQLARNQAMNEQTGIDRTKWRADWVFKEIPKKVKSREDKRFTINIKNNMKTPPQGDLYIGLSWVTNIPKYSEYIVRLFLGYTNWGADIYCVAAQLEVFDKEDAGLINCISSEGFRLFDYYVIHELGERADYAVGLQREEEHVEFEKKLQFFVDILTTVENLEPSDGYKNKP